MALKTVENKIEEKSATLGFQDQPLENKNVQLTEKEKSGQYKPAVEFKEPEKTNAAKDVVFRGSELKAKSGVNFTNVDENIHRF